MKALIDTGARRTVIAPAAAARCKLVAINTDRIFVVGGGEVKGPVYSAQILFDPSPLASWPAMEIIQADLHHPAIECLIGRDLLRRWILEYDGPSGELAISEYE